MKKIYQNKHDKILGSKIVVMKNNFKKFGLFELGFTLGQDIAFGLDIRKFGHSED